MKKFLLLLACAATLSTANADVIANKKFDGDLNKVVFKKGQSVSALSKVNFTMSAADANNKQTAVKPMMQTNRAVSLSTDKLNGDFIEMIYSEYSEEVAVNEAAIVSFEIEEEEGEQWVTLTGVLDGNCELYGLYDPEASTISIQSQVYCQDNAKYGKFVFLTYAGTSFIEDPYILDVEEDENGYLVLTSAEDQVAEGWFVYMAEGEYEGECWTRGEELTYFAPNASLDCRERHVAESAWTSWTDYQEPVYIYQDFGGITTIYGMFGSAVAIVEDEEGNFVLPNGQEVYAAWDGSDYFTFYTYNCYVDEEDYLHPYMLGDEDDCLPDPEGNLPGEIYVLKDGTLDYVFGVVGEDNKVAWDYVYVAKFTSSDGYGYFKNFFAAMEVTTKFVYGSGIDNVKSVNADAPVYNLMGQRVDKNFKGITISNGVKSIR